MPINAIVDSLDSVPEQYRDLYAKKGDKYEVTGVVGMKTQGDVDRVQQALNSERTKATGFETLLKAWGDRKPEEVLPLLDKMPELEAAAAAGKNKLDEKQIEAIVNGRVAPLQRDLEKAKADHLNEQKKVQEFETQSRRRTIFDAVRGIATETKARPESYADNLSGLMLLSEQLFTVDATGQVVVKEGVPDLTHGTRAKDIVGELQRKYPYYWPESTGGGAPGSGGGGASPTNNPFKTNNQTARNEFAKNFPDKVAGMVSAAGLTNAWDTYKAK